MRLLLGILLYNWQVALLEDEDLVEGKWTVYISIASPSFSSGESAEMTNCIANLNMMQ